MAESGGALRELVAFLGFSVDDKPLEKADERLKKTLETAKRVAELWAGAFAVHEFGEFIQGQIEMGDALEHTSDVLGISADELQRFSYAANIADVDSASAANSLGFLNRAIGAAGEGQQEAAKAFSDFHVALKNVDGSARPLSAIVADLADGFAKTDDAGKKTYVAMTLFGRSGRDLIPLLNKGRAGIEGLYSEFDKLGGGLDENFIQSAGEADHAMKQMRFAGRNLSSEIGAVLLPYVAEFASGVAGLATKFRELTKRTHFVRNALILLAAISAMLVVVWGVMNIEILVVVAALILLAVAVDDLITFFEGGQSAIGEFLDKIYGIGESKKIAQQIRDAWKEVSDAFGKLWDSVKDLGPTVKDLFDTFSKKDSADGAKSTIQTIADAMKGLADETKKALDFVNDLIKKFDEFAKAHPFIVHAAQRSAHQVGQGNVGIGGALKAVGGDVVEAVTGDTSIKSYDEAGAGKVSAPGSFHVPLDRPMYVPPSGMALPPVQQHNETNITLYGVRGGQDAATQVKDAVKDAHTEANAIAWPAVGGGGAP